MVEFGEQLRRAREEKGMTQQSLAEQLYVTRQSVSRWECGDRYPDLLTTKKISQILEVSLDDLLSGKEMTKVVERNPVIENKTANNIMIVLYAFVVLTYLITVFDICIRLTLLPADSMDAASIYFLVIRLLALVISIATFSYGLVNAVRGTLSPKRMGAVLVTYFVVCVLSNTNNMFPRITGPEDYIIISLSSILPNIIGGIASFFYFIKADKRKIWICLIALVSIWEIFRAVLSLYPLILGAGELYAMNLSASIFLSIAIDVLIIYQTYTLYRKRLTASAVSE